MMKLERMVNPKELGMPEKLLHDTGIDRTDHAFLYSLGSGILLLKGKMTAMETIETAQLLAEASTELSVGLAKACGKCDGCEDAAEMIRIAEPDSKHDLADVPPDYLELLMASGVCLKRLEELLKSGEAIFA